MSRARQHPTGLAALGTSAVVLVLLRLGVELTPEEVTVLGGVVAVLVSAISPRNVEDRAPDGDA